MKKIVYTTIIASSILLTSCSSGWNCKARYVKSDMVKKNETQHVA